MLTKIDLIDYLTLQNLKPAASLLDAANMTYASAAYLFGKNSLEQQAVRKGWLVLGSMSLIQRRQIRVVYRD